MLRATVRSLLARKLRLLLSAMAVVLGVAFVSGALTLTSTLGQAVDDLFAGTGANTDVEVRGPVVIEGVQGDSDQRGPVPASVLSTLRGVEGVRAAAGDIDGYAALVVRDGTVSTARGAPSLGATYDTDPATSAFTIRTGRPPSGAGEVALDVASARTTGYVVGDVVPVITREGPGTFTLSGTFGVGTSDAVAGASLIAMDEATAQQLLGQPGEYTRVRLAAEDGLSQAQLLERVTAALPAGLEAVTGTQASDEAAGEVQTSLGFFTTFLLVFAGVALFVGGFLIFNTFTILVAQRSRELALLRALGASRGQVTRSVVVEALAVGLLASLVGFAAGLGVAVGLRSLVSSFGGTLPAGPLVITWTTLLVSLAVGTVVTMLSALLPARRASAVPPVAAMRAAVQAEGSLRRTSVLGAVLLVVGVAAIAVGLQGNLVVLGAGALVAFLGVGALSPLLSRPVVSALGAPFARGVPGRLGRLNAMRNPRRTAATATALTIGLALVSAVSVLGASAKTSVEAAVSTSVPADLIVQGVGGADVSPVVAERLAALPEVAQADRIVFDGGIVAGEDTAVTVVDSRALGTTLDLDTAQGELVLAADQILVSRSYAEDRGLQVGQDVPVTLFRGEQRSYRLAGTYERNDLVGAVLLDGSVRPDVRKELDDLVLVGAREGTTAETLRTAVGAIAADQPTIEVLDGEELTAQFSGQIDTVTSVITVLLALSVLIAVLGILNTLALSVLERTRELGLLRAVGLSRRQTRRMVTVEAVVVSTFGALLGIGVGTALGIAFQRALADVGITDLTVPVGRLVAFVLVAALAGVVAALLPARRAARLDVLRAIATA